LETTQITTKLLSPFGVVDLINQGKKVIMATLGNPKNTIEILNKYKFVFQKKFGQNFLIDTHVLDKIINSANITKEDFILEIGPGIGTMTQYLAENARKVIAVEIDKMLIPILNDTLSPYDNVTLINEDVLALNINELVKRENDGKPIKVVANLPYYITTPIIMGLFESHVPIDSITIMVQKEVAERMQAGPGSKNYGALSLAVQYYCEPYIVANVPPNCFMPRPNVGSAVIRLTGHKESPVKVENEKLMFRLIRASFNQRRKTLVNGLNNAPDISFSKEELIQALEKMGLSINIRGEALTLSQFAILTNHLLHEKSKNVEKLKKRSK
jgi:16S rRNA (adenine1518-N6/adenine1519-N6)-dimethyltransferase